jgi:predicted Zn-dependent protease with MMP-like domain
MNSRAEKERVVESHRWEGIKTSHYRKKQRASALSTESYDELPKKPTHTVATVLTKVPDDRGSSICEDTTLNHLVQVRSYQG